MAVLATAQQNSRSAERSSKESLVPEPSTRLQLPRQDAPSQFQPIPSYLPRQDPPQEFAVPSYYLANQDFPAPTNSREDSYLPLPYSSEYSESAESLGAPPRELVPPSAEPWNPSGDKTLYFIIPDVVTKQKTPTGYFPKKYNPGFEKVCLQLRTLKVQHISVSQGYTNTCFIKIQ